MCDDDPNLWPDGGTAYDCGIYYAQKAAELGVAIYPLGLGVGADMQFLGAIAQETGGQVYSVLNPADLPAVFDAILSSVLADCPQLPARPALIAPPDQHLNNTGAITFQWTPRFMATNYTLKISDTLATTPATWHSLSLADGVYTWTAQALYESEQIPSGYTDTWRLTVDTTPPAAPSLISPPDGALTTTHRITFDWSDVADALSGPVTYTLALSGHTPLPLADSRQVYTLPDGVYTWTVSAADRAGNVSPPADVFAFSIETKYDIYLPVILE